MGVGLLQAYLDTCNAIGAGIADERRDGYDKKYEYADATKGASAGYFSFSTRLCWNTRSGLRAGEGGATRRVFLR
jgi:hypothetical protein